MSFILTEARMKRSILFAILFCLVPAGLLAADPFDSCAVDNAHTAVLKLCQGFGGFYMAGETFTGADVVVDSAQFMIRKNTANAGYVRVQIWTHTGTWGTSGLPGALLAESDSISYTQLPPDLEPVWFGFHFTGANRITLTDGTHYCIDVIYNYGDYVEHFPTIRYNTVSTVNGNQYIQGTYTGLAAVETQDTVFRIYGTVVTPPSPGGGGQVIIISE